MHRSSGTGTLARNPEIKWRLKEGDLAEFQELQRRMLKNALGVFEAGGCWSNASFLERRRMRMSPARIFACRGAMWGTVFSLA